MTATRLRALAERIASAPREAETALFEEAHALLTGHAAPEDTARWTQLIRCGAFNETAIAIYHAMFAERGFQFGSLATKPPCGLASSWRMGDGHAAVHRAATPALALLRAAASESAARMEEETAAKCSVCGGSGWFVTAADGRRTCRHARQAA
jgi:hypothetical protein